MSSAILLSGGMDSTAVAYWKRPQKAYTIDYGQVCVDGEARAARAVCDTLGIEHQLLAAKVPQFGSGDLAGQAPSSLASVSEWWPFRNQYIITVAAMHAVQDKVSELIFGTVTTDGHHADGTIEFFDAIAELIYLQEGHLKINAPALHLTTTELIHKSKIPQDILLWSHSCHKANFACGYCRGCDKHFEVRKSLSWDP